MDKWGFSKNYDLVKKHVDAGGLNLTDMQHVKMLKEINITDKNHMKSERDYEYAELQRKYEEEKRKREEERLARKEKHDSWKSFFDFLKTTGTALLNLAGAVVGFAVLIYKTK